MSDPADGRECSTCKVWKPRDQYYTTGGRGRQRMCRACQCAYERERYGKGVYKRERRKRSFIELFPKWMLPGVKSVQRN